MRNGFYVPAILTLPQGREFQLDYRIERKWKIEYSGCDMLCSGHYKHDNSQGTKSPSMRPDLSEPNRTNVILLGSHIQAWSSRSYQSQCDYRLRQSRQEEVPYRIRRICSDQCYKADRPRRNQQISHKWPSSAAANCSEPLSIRSTQHQQPQFPHYARPDYKGFEHEGGGNFGDD